MATTTTKCIKRANGKSPGGTDGPLKPVRRKETGILVERKMASRGNILENSSKRGDVDKEKEF